MSTETNVSKLPRSYALAEPTIPREATLKTNKRYTDQTKEKKIAKKNRKVVEEIREASLSNGKTPPQKKQPKRTKKSTQKSSPSVK